MENQRHIQNLGLFRTLGYSEPEAYSEPCQTSMIEHFEKQLTAIIILASYNYFRNISFSCPLVHEINMIFFNVGLIFTGEVFTQFKVACVVNANLFFYGLILLKFDNNNQVMQNPMQKFRQSSIVLKIPGFLS